MKKNKLLMGFLLLFALFGFTRLTPVAAADNGANFTIAPVYPSNQTDKALGYFRLETPADYKGQLQVTVANLDEQKTRTFRVSPVAATTSDEGQINYTPSSAKPDPSAQYVLTQFLSKPVTVTLEPRTQKTVTFEYQIPKKGFKGTLLGSIYVLDTTASDQKTKGFALKNRFAMALGVSMSMDIKHMMAPDLKLGAIKASTRQNKPIVAARLRNVKPSYFRKMSVTTKITKAGQTRRLYQGKLTGGSMAPNSNFEFATPTKGKVIPAGRYRYDMTVKATGRTWHFTKYFTISRAQHNKLANKNGEKPTSNWWYWLIALLLLLLLILVAWLFYLLGKRRREEEDDDEKQGR